MDWRERRYFAVKLSPKKDYEMQLQLIRLIPRARLHPRNTRGGGDETLQRGSGCYYQYMVSFPKDISEDAERYIVNLVAGMAGGFCKEVKKRE